MNFARLALPVAATAAAALVLGIMENDARALGPVDVEAGVKVGAATNPADGINPFGFGAGVRAGVGIFGFYGGLSAVHYFGSSTDILGQSVRTSTTLLGFELGYTISTLRVVLIRPQLGIGSATGYASGGGLDSSDSRLYLEPGVAVLVPIGLLYVGGDANALILPNSQTSSGDKTYTSLTLHAQVGVRF